MYNTETPAFGFTRTLEPLLSRAHTEGKKSEQWPWNLKAACRQMEPVVTVMKRRNSRLTDKWIYHSYEFIISFHWPRAHNVTCK